MKLRSSKAAIAIGLILSVLAMPFVPNLVEAQTTNEQQNENSEAIRSQISYVDCENESEDDTKKVETDIYENLAVVTASSSVDVFVEPDESSQTAGRIYCDNIATVLEFADDYTFVQSGNVRGYVNTAALCFGDEAKIIVEQKGGIVASVAAEDTEVLASLTTGETHEAVQAGNEYKVIAKCGNYVVVSYNDDKAYISAEKVNVRYPLTFGLTNEEIEAAEAAKEAQRLAEEAARAEAERAEAEALQAQIDAAKKDLGITYNPVMEATPEEIWLLSVLIDWEAGWEPYEGKLAVANVVLNRVRYWEFADTITGVIYQKRQFSGVSDGNGNPSERFSTWLERGPRFEDCTKAALEALSGVNNIGDYLYFRSSSIANYASYSSYAIIGSHTFY